MRQTVSLDLEHSHETRHDRQRLTPSIGRTPLSHDIKMRPKPILIRRAAPLLIPIRRTQIRNHDRDTFPCTCAVALATGSNGADIGQFIAATASAAAPGGGSAVVEQRGASCCCPDGAGAELPGECAGGTAAAGADCAVVVVL